jgi:hypothetical protein
VAKFASIASLVVVGIIIADILIHPAGTAQAMGGLIGMENSAVGGLLGAPPSGSNLTGGGM